MSDELLSFTDSPVVEIVEIQRLEEWNIAYRLGSPIVTDSVYDSLYRETREKHPDNAFFTQVGFLSDEFGEDVVLEYMMGSLANYHYYEDKRCSEYKKSNDIETWLEKHRDGSGWTLMDKIDGLSIQVTWEMGEVSHAELRGDGFVGKDCTDKARVMFPQKIPYHKLVLRGEATLTAPPSELGYKNRRNGAVGLMKKQSLDRVEFLTAYFYEMIEKIDHVTLDGVVVNSKPETVSDQLAEIASMNLPVVLWRYISPSVSIADVAKMISLDATNFTDDLYDADGKVICPNSYVWEEVHIPERKIAFKSHSEAVSTTVLKIDIQVSRLGKLIPVVYYEPIEMGGATLSKATGFNFKFINDNQIGVGSKILVCRSEEVIPYVKGVVTATGAVLPELCPRCGTHLGWDDNEVHIICTNNECPPRVIKSLTHFFIALGLEEFSESSFEKLGISNIMDVYALTSEKIQAIEGFGENTSVDLVKRIHDTLDTRPEFLIQALGINGIGKTVSKLLVNNYSWEKIKNAQFTINELMELPDIGETTAKAIIEGITTHRGLIDGLEELGMVVNTSSGNLTGKQFCVTGKLETMKRSEIEKWVIENGGEITGIKKSDTMYLVCNNSSSSAKYRKAIEYGIPIITEHELFDMG